MQEIDLALMTGIDIPIPECNLVIHQPTIKEIAFIGEKDYFLAVQTLCVDKQSLAEDPSILNEITNFQLFLAVMADKSFSDKKNAIKKALTILFPNYTVMIMPNTLSFFQKNSEDQTGILMDDQNFECFQQILREICCLRSGDMQEAGFNPRDDRAKEIAAKLMRGRQRVAAQKNETTNFSLLGQYISILTVGLASISMSESCSLTMFQLFDLVERYSKYSAWDIDVKVRLAGGKSDKEPENWMKNIH